jgi:hypothetical protein
MVQYILRRDFHSALIIFCLFLIACAPSNVVQYKQSDGKTSRYDVIEIPNFTKTDSEWVPYDSYTQIPDMLAEKLRTTNEFREIRRSEYNTPTQERVLLVKGTVTGYTRGCKYCEWLIRVNDKGKGSLSVWVRLIDKTTGDALTDAGIEGRAVKPGYGKSRYVRIVDEIGHLIENVNKGKS